MFRQVIHFIAHLRLPYQTLLLSGAYGLSIIFVSAPDLGLFSKYFFLWHLGLYGGATAFNSYWDKDKGPIGGLKNPPPMRPWMRWASFLMMVLPAPILIHDICLTILRNVYQQGYKKILIEGGIYTLKSFLNAQLVNELYIVKNKHFFKKHGLLKASKFINSLKIMPDEIISLEDDTILKYKPKYVYRDNTKHRQIK